MFDLHSVLGLYAALILLVCALTGLMWSFQWYRDIVSFIFDAEVKRGAPIWRIVHALHFGTYAGMFSKIVTFIAALIGTSLPVTGYWMYLKRKNYYSPLPQISQINIEMIIKSVKFAVFSTHLHGLE